MLQKSLPKFLILPFSLIACFSWSAIFNSSAFALPGQPTEDVAAWIKAHPTLRPSPVERFFVQKSDTAAQRFSFQASVLAAGKVGFTKDRSKIRNERITMFDAVNGMTFDRLQESLRSIYGLEIYQDFKNARVVYEYPDQSIVNASRFAKTPIKEALQGQLRVGDRYAYWVEVAQPRDGKAFTGQMTVLLKSDLEKLESELKLR